MSPLGRDGPNLFLAAGRVNGADGVLLGGTGAATARTGAGVYTLTLPDGGVDALEGLVLATAEGATVFTVNIEHTSDTVKTIRTFVGAVATDATFGFFVFQFGP